MRLIAANDSARLFQRGARVLERAGRPYRSGQAEPNNEGDAWRASIAKLRAGQAQEEMLEANGRNF